MPIHIPTLKQVVMLSMFNNRAKLNPNLLIF